MEADSDSSYRGETPEPRTDGSPNIRATIETSGFDSRNHLDEQESSDYAPSETNSDGEYQGSPTAVQSRKSSPLKRPAQEEREKTPRPSKRNRTQGSLNHEYLNLLNQDIENAARRCEVIYDSGLEPAQQGLIQWTVTEQETFFQALARLGRHDLPGLAACIGSKSEIEVHHYLTVLQTASDGRKQDLRLRPAMVMSEYPAAIELSQQCCHAQEVVADELSLQVERREQLREEKVWGDVWNITTSLAAAIDRETDRARRYVGEESESETKRQELDGQAITQQSGGATAETRGSKGIPYSLPSSQLFKLSEWLLLSSRMFMNSTIPGNNWQDVEKTPPSMWATTFEDFHALTVSFTRRVVQTTLFFAMSRIRAHAMHNADPARKVRAQDVVAAVRSLGLPENGRQFWRKSARRLRLHVYDEPPGRDEEENAEPMTYEAVEHLLKADDDLSGDAAVGMSEEGLEIAEQGGQTPREEYEEVEQDDNSDDDDDGDDIIESNDNLTDDDEEEEEEEDPIQLESLEILNHTAAEFPETKRAKDSLLSRIAIERQQEDDAERADQQAGWQEEAMMWKLLGRQPPMEIPKPATVHPGTPPRSVRNLEGIFPPGRKDWKETTRYYAEWETKLEGQGPEVRTLRRMHRHDPNSPGHIL